MQLNLNINFSNLPTERTERSEGNPDSARVVQALRPLA